MCRQAFVASMVPLVGVCAPAPASQAAPSDAPLCPAQRQQQQQESHPPVRIAYEVHGSGPIHVLLVPGMCVSRRMWDAQLAEFAKYPDMYSVCLLDNRGSGQSDIPPAALFNNNNQNVNYSIDTLARDAWTVADVVFGPDAKVHIAGHSMGSMIAQRFVFLS
jgi:pimeloyl-ACP methyl ester carboxylesterase